MISDLDLECMRIDEVLPKVIGMWISYCSQGCEYSGQLYFGKHAHRTSDFLYYYEGKDVKAMVSTCNAHHWTYTLLFEEAL